MFETIVIVLDEIVKRNMLQWVVVLPLLSAADVGELDVLELIVGVTHGVDWTETGRELDGLDLPESTAALILPLPTRTLRTPDE